MTKLEDSVLWVDSHCHLGMEQFDLDREDVIKRALSSGIETILLPGTCKSDIITNLKIIEKYPVFVTTAGIHPHEAGSFNKDGLEYLIKVVKGNKISGIGEIGLDFHYDFCEKRIQIETLEREIALAIERKLPVVIHCREAFSETYDILKKHINIRGVFHCFTYGKREAIKILDLGFYISFSGIITFKKGVDGIKDAMKIMPLDKILIETDSPYLAPMPYRGKRNEPSYVANIGIAVAKILNKDIIEISQITKENFMKLFLLHPEIS